MSWKKKSQIKLKNKESKTLSLDELSLNQLNVLASDIRSDILSVCLNNGGHLSSNLGAVELTIECLKVFDPLKDDILFDVGHQAYTYKILTGRDLKTIRTIDGISPFLSKEESIYDKYCSGHAGDCLPICVGIAESKTLNNDDSYTICISGDSSLLNGLSFEALNYLSEHKLKKLIIVLNDNGMGISENVGVLKKQFQKLRNSKFYFNTSSLLSRKLSKRKFSLKVLHFLQRIKNKFRQIVLPNNFFESMGLKYIGPFDGNDFSSLDLAFKKAKECSNNGPVVLHLITKKGFGYYPAMNDGEGIFHGVSPDFDDKRYISKDETFLTLKEKYLFSLLEKDKDSIVITPAMLIGSKLENLKIKYPDRVIDLGIAEENAVCFATGLALKNKHPIIDIYSTFLQRSYDEIFEDLIRNEVSSLVFIERAGLVGEDGKSHQGLYDVSFLKSIPNINLYMPFDKKTFKLILEDFHFENNKSVFIRLSKDNLIREDYPIYLSNKNYIMYKKANKNLIISIGQEGFKLIKKFFPDDFSLVTLLNLLPNKEILSTLNFNEYDNVIIYDPYSTKRGTVEYLSLYLNEIQYKGNYFFFSFENDFIKHGSISSLYKYYQLDNESVFEKIKNILK